MREMATFDRAQGISFVYSHNYEVYKKLKEEKLDSIFIVNRGKASVLKASNHVEHKIEQYEPKALKVAEGGRLITVPKEASVEQAVLRKLGSATTLKNNLQNLQDA